jgi:hypothetical protein
MSLVSLDLLSQGEVPTSRSRRLHECRKSCWDRGIGMRDVQHHARHKDLRFLHSPQDQNSLPLVVSQVKYNTRISLALCGNPPLGIAITAEEAWIGTKNYVRGLEELLSVIKVKFRLIYHSFMNLSYSCVSDHDTISLLTHP